MSGLPAPESNRRAYLRGWRDGANGREASVALGTSRDCYEQGYRDGSDALSAAHSRARELEQMR